MEIRTNDRFSKAYVEVLEVIAHMKEEYQLKIPQKLLNWFENNRDENYKYHISNEQSIKEQNLSQETISILAVLELKYWATPEEKEVLKQELINNESKYQKELREKYNPDNIFKNRFQFKVCEPKIEEKLVQKETALVEVKENSFMKWIKKLKQILRF